MVVFYIISVKLYYVTL